MSRLTTRMSIMGRKHDIEGGQAHHWKKLLKNYDYPLIEEAVDKLGDLEDIEEELGCSFRLMTEAIKNGIWIIPPHSEKKIPMFVRHPYLTFDESINKKGEMERKPLFFFMYRFDENIHNSGYYFLEDCGKTWALTREGLGK